MTNDLCMFFITFDMSLLCVVRVTQMKRNKDKLEAYMD